MSTPIAVEQVLARVGAGERLPPDEVVELAAAADVLALGMIADAARRHLHGSQVTYLRVAPCPFDAPLENAVPPAAREVRLSGSPPALADAAAAVERARAVAGARLVSGFAWPDIVRLARHDGAAPARVLTALRAAGLEALSQVAVDDAGSAADALEALAAAGFVNVRVTCAGASAERAGVILRAAALQDRFGVIRALNPLASIAGAPRPSTGYDDVKAVAVARIAAPNIPTVQVDWHRCGAKLAQVALTFGADDLDGVPASDDPADGPRRTLVSEVRRNIEAAAFVPAERDGRFDVVA